MDKVNLLDLPVFRLFVALFLLALLLGAAAAMVGCQYKEGDEAITPTDPPAPTCTSDPPDALQVSARPSGCTDDACIASFSVSNLGLARISWSFPEGDPPESPNGSVQVEFPRKNSFPISYGWSLTACTCSRTLDPDGDSCRSASGTVVFNSLDG